MTKKSLQNSDHSRDREFTVVLEDLRSQFRTFGEGLADVRRRLENLDIDVTQLKEDMRLIKIAVPQIFTRLNDHDRRLTALETVK